MRLMTVPLLAGRGSFYGSFYVSSKTSSASGARCGRYVLESTCRLETARGITRRLLRALEALLIDERFVVCVGGGCNERKADVEILSGRRRKSVRGFCTLVGWLRWTDHSASVGNCLGD